MTGNLEKYMYYDLNALLNYKYAITLKEIFQGFEDDSITRQLAEKIESDPRFISISNIRPETIYYISKEVLNSWFAWVIDNLIEANRNSLNGNELTKYLNSLFPLDKLDMLPNEIIDYGSSYGFVGRAYAPDKYVFPIAHILSFVSKGIKNHAIQLIIKLNEIQYRDANLRELFTKSIDELFSDLNEKSKYVLFRRIGLNTKIMTLEGIGNNLQLTRERVRQIEEKCWSDLQKFGSIKFLASAFISDILINRGSLITNDNNESTTLKLLLAKFSLTTSIDPPVFM